MKSFEVSLDTMVATSKYITQEGMPILQVDHHYDPEGGDDWEFHCGNDDYAMKNMQLVRLNIILQIDPDIINVSDLPSGYVAVRKSSVDKWEYLKSELRFIS